MISSDYWSILLFIHAQSLLSVYSFPLSTEGMRLFSILYMCTDRSLREAYKNNMFQINVLQSIIFMEYLLSSCFHGEIVAYRIKFKKLHHDFQVSLQYNTNDFLSLYMPVITCFRLFIKFTTSRICLHCSLRRN